MMTICLIGAFDTKGTEYAFVRDRIRERGHDVLTVNTGVLGSTDLFGVDVEADEVARAGGTELERLRGRRDRGEAMRVITAGAPAVVAGLHERRPHRRPCSAWGGTGGTTVVTAAHAGAAAVRANGMRLHRRPPATSAPTSAPAGSR